MLKNSEVIEEFKKSLSATVKSIGKNDEIEINFVKENSSINGNTVNLIEPNIENIKNNLTYLRAEAESMTADTKRSGCCTHTGKHYTEAVDFWAHGDIEMRIDSVEVQGSWFR